MAGSGGISEALEPNLPFTIVIFGATGDLARKKLFPALYQLLYGCPDAPLLPTTTKIVGYGRATLKVDAFAEKQCVNVVGPDRAAFVQRISYFQGNYDREEDFVRLHNSLVQMEETGSANRMFFLSVPPTVFCSVCENIHRNVRPANGFVRLLIEKPFGRDSRTFKELDDKTSGLFREEQIFRIDHYLAKEQVLNLVALRFANQVYEPLWNRRHIKQVQIVFKENIGTGGRGGYFDNFGIIRDIIQNHLLQVFLWLSMEPPEVLNAASIATEKCRLLRSTRTLSMNDCFLGQFSGNTWQENGDTRVEPGYLDDKTVPADSRCPTFAAAVLRVDNERWQGVPFLLRAGKGLDERLAEVRVTFRRQRYNDLIQGDPNELLLRIQPDEGICLRCTNKAPGWNQGNVAPVRMDMSYRTAFPDNYVAGAYERMLLNASRGERSLFVGSGELTEAWRIFTPLLDEIDKLRPHPVSYPFGVSAPDGAAEFALKHGIMLEGHGDAENGSTDGWMEESGYTPKKSFVAGLHRSPASEDLQPNGSKREGRESTPPRKWRKLKSYCTL